MKFVGGRELRNNTGKVLRTVQKGEKVFLTKRTKPVAALVPLVEEDIQRMVLEGRAWLRLSESAFDFWENDEDDIWNQV